MKRKKHPSCWGKYQLFTPVALELHLFFLSHSPPSWWGIKLYFLAVLVHFLILVTKYRTNSEERSMGRLIGSLKGISPSRQVGMGTHGSTVRDACYRCSQQTRGQRPRTQAGPEVNVVCPAQCVRRTAKRYY